MRISGLATGMDTEQIIKDMMNAHRIPINKITQKKQYLEWQLDDYRAVNRQLFDFSQNIFDNMILSKNFNQKNVTISAPDDVAIKNISSTSDFSGTIEIHQLAKNATLQGREIKKASDEKYTTEEIQALKISELSKVPSDFTITVTAPGMNEPKTLTFTADDTIGNVIKKINEETGISAFYDEFTGTIATSAKNGGSDKLQITGGLAVALEINGESTNGQNAIFTFNGLKTERSSNTFQINGFELTLKQVTSPLNADGTVATGGKVVSFNSSPDTEKIFENVVKFIDDYNKLIEDLNKQIREPKHRSFQPLSDEQKKEMKEKEIELWEEKAKSGTLRNDSTISSLLTQMRTALSGSIDKQSLSSIGISTSNNYLDHGKLIIDEDKLKQAISEDPGNVHKLFSFDAGKDASKTEHGFARQLRTIVDDAQKSIAKRAGKVGDVNDTFTLGKNLNDMNKQIERFEDRLRMTEDRLWKQFTAMERAIQRSNMQSASLMNAFGGGM
ncbi:flagellar hook-associated protein 2 [Sporosarcina sp. Marseille-Q4943]|uniref:flagellar hook-associated protein 2 n=1 Tax=Sporosarcina sp. Marseille-Q4943 TaxID=2942204 RepID=UPI00208DA68F|nr:flagellar hook-associated protein 2 [Sporosarcina sp. Marseille-Q4943]